MNEILRKGMAETEQRSRKLLMLIDLCSSLDMSALPYLKDLTGVGNDEGWDERFTEIMASLTNESKQRTIGND